MAENVRKTKAGKSKRWRASETANECKEKSREKPLLVTFLFNAFRFGVVYPDPMPYVVHAFSIKAETKIYFPNCIFLHVMYAIQHVMLHHLLHVCGIYLSCFSVY